ncbi:hypothetical protein ABZ070_34865 [Streptomyces sp. NPDC006283]|uniref:hypothetical protein n=1 Tax=Streptomyces sp. NPDC006283 TaxID=3156741 RepID=UPI00339E347F
MEMPLAVRSGAVGTTVLPEDRQLTTSRLANDQVVKEAVQGSERGEFRHAPDCGVRTAIRARPRSADHRTGNTAAMVKAAPAALAASVHRFLR